MCYTLDWVVEGNTDRNIQQIVGFQKPKGSTIMTDTTEVTKPTFAAGSWQETLDKSATLFDRSNKGRAKASSLLWQGAQVAIEEWLDSSDTDVHAEVLNADIIDILGKERKGDASKIKTVALAVKGNGLVLATYPNLSKAYAEAIRLTKTVAAQADEDTAADEAVQSIEAPKTASTAEAAAKILLAKGVDEAVRVLLDVLNGAAVGVENTPAHRSFLRAVAQEINGRQTKPEPKAPKAPAKAKPAAKKAAAPAKKAAGAKPKPKAKPAPAAIADPFEVEDGEVEDLDESIFDEFDEITEEAPVETPAASKPKPVRRGPVRR